MILKDLKAGKYRSSYLIYNRKSTDDLNNQKNSISYQNAENGKFARRTGLRIANITIAGFCVDGIISEKHSGFKESGELIFGDHGMVQYRIDRPKFYKLVQFLNEGYFKGFVVLCWDRVSRNKSDASIVRKLMSRGVDVRFVHASYDKTSSGELHMDIDGMFAEHHSRVTSEKVKLNIRNLRDKGVCTYKAPVGYINNGNMYDKPFDLTRTATIVKMFELCATGTWSLSDLTRWSNRQGFTMPRSRKPRTEKEMLLEDTDETVKSRPIERPLTPTGVHKILTNKFYLGLIRGNNGEYIPSISHKPLISEELFYRVQRQLNKKKVSVHYADKITYPYRGFIRCDLCERVYTPYSQKGIIYYGCRCKGACGNTNKHINIEFIETNIKALISNLTFTDDELSEIDSRAHTDIALLESRRCEKIEEGDRRKKKIRADISYLRSNKLNLLITSVYSPEEYLAEEERLNQELREIQDAEQDSDIAMHEVVKTVVKLSELLKDAALYYENALSHEKEEIVRIIFSELTISEKTLKFKCTEGFKPFEKRMLSYCDLTGWLSELTNYYPSMQVSIAALEELMN